MKMTLGHSRVLRVWRMTPLQSGEESMVKAFREGEGMEDDLGGTLVCWEYGK